VEEASKMRLLGNGNSVSTEVCDGLDNVVLAVMASGLLMSQRMACNIEGYVESQPFGIQIVKSNCDASISQCELPSEIRLETVEKPCLGDGSGKQGKSKLIPAADWVTKMYSTGPAYCMLSCDCQFSRLWLL